MQFDPAYREVDAVDLGLPSGTLWADRNIGASSSLDYGLYFTWGSINGFSKDSERSLSGVYNGQRDWEGTYSFEHGSELDDSQNIPTNEYYDAARKYLGEPWKIPTQAQWDELFNNNYTTHSVVVDGETNQIFCHILSKINRNSIQLPLAGCFSSHYIESDEMGYYWTSTPMEEDYAYANKFTFRDEFYLNADEYRWNAMSIRACYKP